MFGTRKPEASGHTPPTTEGSPSPGNLFGNLGLPNDKAINPADVYAITGEQLMSALQSAIAVGQSQSSCKQCERLSVRTPNVPLPSFSGSLADKGGVAKNFLRKLESYVASQRYTHAEALEMVVPCAMDGPAGLWWESRGGKFQNWHDFLCSFRKEYGIVEYVNVYRQMANNLVQHPDEPLVDFATEIVSCYREFSPRAPDQEVIDCILKQAHPECRILLKQKAFTTIEELKDVAKEVDETLAEIRQYRESTEDKSSPKPDAAAAEERSPSSMSTIVKEDPPDLTPTKEPNATKTWKSGKLNAVAQNDNHFEEKEVFLPPWAEKDQSQKQFGYRPTFARPGFRFQRPHQRFYPRCYICGLNNHFANNCRKARHHTWDDDHEGKDEYWALQ